MKPAERELLTQLGLRPGQDLLYQAILELGRRCLTLERRLDDLSLDLATSLEKRSVRKALDRFACGLHKHLTER